MQKVQIKVKAHPVGQPEKVRYFTQEAFNYINADQDNPKWVLAGQEDQPVTQKKKE